MLCPQMNLKIKTRKMATSGMLALIYVFAIWCVATVLYGIVNKHEPNRGLALVLKFLILAVSAAAIASRLAP
jgi:hypothetical protein